MKQRKRKHSEMDKHLQVLIDEYSTQNGPGPIQLTGVARWILDNKKFHPNREEINRLMMRHLSRVMTTQYVETEDGRRVRKKHVVRHKEVGPDGKKQMIFSWLDIEIAPPQFMFESLQQRRSSIADICWQADQDHEGYNKFYNKGQPIPKPHWDFREDVAERQAELDYNPPPTEEDI